MKKIGLLLSPFLFAACATVQTAREPSTYLMNTNKGQAELLAQLETLLTNNKYEIKTYDNQSGILVSKPRLFTYGADKARAKHSVQLRQEGGSVSLRVVYECEYAEKGGGKEFGDCNEGDSDFDSKAKKIESTLVRIIREKVESN